MGFIFRMWLLTALFYLSHPHILFLVAAHGLPGVWAGTGRERQEEAFVWRRGGAVLAGLCMQRRL